MSAHGFVHVELSTKDREADAKFYNELFGWTFRQIPEMNYATFETGDKLGGGLNPVENEPISGVTVYVHTDDVEATLAKAASLGATILTPKTEIPTVGWFGFIQDPSGNKIGLLQPLPGM